MNYRVVFSARFDRSVGRLIAYLGARFSEENAEEFVTKLIDICNGLATFPNRGTRRLDLGPEFRVIGYRDIVTILFRVSDKTRTVTLLNLSYRGRVIQP